MSIFSNMHISTTTWPIAIKFYLKHQWGWGKAALGFGSDRIRTLVFMATVNSYNEKCCGRSSAFILDRLFLILAGGKDIHNISKLFEIRPNRTKDCGVSYP